MRDKSDPGTEDRAHCTRVIVGDGVRESPVCRPYASSWGKKNERASNVRLEYYRDR